MPSNYYILVLETFCQILYLFRQQKIVLFEISSFNVRGVHTEKYADAENRVFTICGSPPDIF